MTLSIHRAGRDKLIATNAILLNIKYEFYEFSGDLIEATKGTLRCYEAIQEVIKPFKK